MTEHSKNRRLERIYAMIEAEKPDEVVVGLPKNMNGTEGERAQMSRDFVAELKQRGCTVPIILWDERGTSKMANRILSDNGKKRGKQRAVVDAVAASIILQSYLDYKGMHTL